MTAKIVLELTLAEAKALMMMASQVAEHGDVMEQEFPNARRRATASAAYDKLCASLRRSPDKGYAKP